VQERMAVRFGLRPLPSLRLCKIERDGLVEQIRQDGVQKILSDAFAPYREAAL